MDKSTKVRCLIDTGSQRSYISEAAAQDLCTDVNQLLAIEQNIWAYIGGESRDFKQMSTGMKLEERLTFVPLLVDKTMDVKFEVPGMNAVIAKFKINNIRLLDEEFYEERHQELIKVDLLLGIDGFQHISSSVTFDHMLGGSCLVLNDEVAPYGNVFSFLS